MQVKTIAFGQATLRLGPQECRDLALALRASCDAFIDPDHELLFLRIQTYQALFVALEHVTLAHRHLPLPNYQEYRAELPS